MGISERTSKHYGIVSGTLFAAIVLIVMDALIWLGWFFAVQSNMPAEVTRVLKETAIVFAITAIITSVFESIALRKLVKDIEEHTKDQTTKLSQDISPIISAANASGLEGIFSNREATRNAIKSELRQIKKGNLVQIAGIALPEFFIRGNPYVPVVEDMLKDGACLHVILMNPDGQAAHERQSIEGDHPSDFINLSVKQINTLKKDGNDIDFRYYDGRPIVFMLCTDRFLFLEPYSCGKPEEEWNKGFVAGHVPVFQFKSDSKTYTIMKSHFKHLWDCLANSVDTPPQPSTTALPEAVAPGHP